MLNCRLLFFIKSFFLAQTNINFIVKKKKKKTEKNIVGMQASRKFFDTEWTPGCESIFL